MPLQITSLMDMFTIILVFLLFQFSTEDQALVLEKDLKLPMSTAKAELVKTIGISITYNELKVEGNIIGKIEKEKLVGISMEGEKIVPLYNFLTRYRDLQDEAGRRETVIVLQAHREYHYEIIKNVMKTAGMAGYPNFRFAVIKK